MFQIFVISRSNRQIGKQSESIQIDFSRLHCETLKSYVQKKLLNFLK